MRVAYRSALTVAVALVVASSLPLAQGGGGMGGGRAAGAAAGAPQDDGSRVVADGGISVAGWAGKIDANEERQGQVLSNAKFAAEGAGFRVTTGPAVTYWNPANRATGDYTVKAHFNEPQFMNLNNHAHPYGIVIAGNDLGTENQSFLYCAAYGDGRVIVRGFGPAAFQSFGGGRGAQAPSVNRAAGPGSPVEQDIAVSVKGDKVECAVNGQVVASLDKTSLVGEGRLKSTDGVYGIRFAHNTEAIVTGFAMTKP